MENDSFYMICAHGITCIKFSDVRDHECKTLLNIDLDIELDAVLALLVVETHGLGTVLLCQPLDGGVHNGANDGIHRFDCCSRDFTAKKDLKK